jgi:hypothetical protein
MSGPRAGPFCCLEVLVDPIAYLVESEEDEADMAAGALPWGYHEVGPRDVTHRDPSVVETDYEIELRYRDSLELGRNQPVYTCAYCADRFRSASLGAALSWWNAHDCFVLENREQLARLYDLGVSFPQGHPFALTVDGKSVA